MKMKKVLIAATLAASMAFGLFALAGCGGKSDEDAVREAIKAELEAIKGMDQDFVDMLAAETGSDEYAAYGIDMTEFMKGYLEGFDYAIGDIVVAEDGNSAAATVTLTCKSLTDFLAQVQADSAEWATNLDAATSATMTEEDINAAVGAILMDAIAKVEPAQTAPISVVYEKANGNWAAAAGSEDAVFAALMAN